MPPIKNPLLHAYWIEFKPSAEGDQTFMTVDIAGVAHHVARAVGVTAFTFDDALSIVDDELFAEGPRPSIRRVSKTLHWSGYPNSLTRPVSQPGSLRATLESRHLFSRNMVPVPRVPLHPTLPAEISPLLSECLNVTFAGVTDTVAFIPDWASR